MTTPAQPTSSHRIWRHAAAAAALLVLGPTVLVSVGWFTDPGSRDADMTGVWELTFFLLAMTTPPAIAFAFGLMAPLAIALDRLARGHTTRFTNVLIGATFSVPAVVALVAAAVLSRTGFDFQLFTTELFRQFSAGYRPERMLIALGVFVMPGIVVALGMRHRRSGVLAGSGSGSV